MPVSSEPILKKFTRVFIEEGFAESLRVLEESRSTLLSALSNGLLKLFNFGEKITIFLNPHLKETGIESYAKHFSQTRQWKNAAIRCISWFVEL